MEDTLNYIYIYIYINVLFKFDMTGIYLDKLMWLEFLNNTTRKLDGCNKGYQLIFFRDSYNMVLTRKSNIFVFLNTQTFRV